MKKIIKIFYYVSVIIIVFLSFMLALLNGNRDHIINLENKETIFLLSFVLVIIISLVIPLFNKKLKIYSFIISVIALVFCLLNFLRVEALSFEGYMLISWIIITVFANTYLIINLIGKKGNG